MVLNVGQLVPSADVVILNGFSILFLEKVALTSICQTYDHPSLSSIACHPILETLSQKKMKGSFIQTCKMDEVIRQ